MPNPVVATPAAPAQAPVVAKEPVSKPVEAVKPASGGSDESWDVQEDGKSVKKSRKEIIEAYQLRQLSDKRRSEADKTMQEYQKAFKLLKEDPVKFLNATGLDFDKLSTSYLAKKAEEAMMDPKEREAQQLKAENEKYKKWQEEQEKAKKDSEVRAQIEQERTRINAEIIEAIEAHKELGMPVDEELIIQIAQKMILQDKKQKPLNAKEALPKAYESTQKFLKGIASKMDGEPLIKWLGEDVVKKIRKYDLAELKKRMAGKGPVQTERVVPKTDVTKDKPQYTTWSTFKKNTLDKIV